jgi:hypothetical protein
VSLPRPDQTVRRGNQRLPVPPDIMIFSAGTMATDRPRDCTAIIRHADRSLFRACTKAHRYRRRPATRSSSVLPLMLDVFTGPTFRNTPYRSGEARRVRSRACPFAFYASAQTEDYDNALDNPGRLVPLAQRGRRSKAERRSWLDWRFTCPYIG